MAFAVGSGKWFLKADQQVKKFPLYNNSGGDLTAGTAVVISSGTLAAIGDNNQTGIHGVLEDNIASADFGAIQAEGLFTVDVNGSINFAMYDPVYSYTGGKVDQGTALDKEVGRIAPGADPASAAAQVQVVMRGLYFIADLLAHA
jgi:hypothetical protein